VTPDHADRPPAGFDTVSFLSDLGSVDESAGVVRSVLADLAPHVRIIDLTHEIPPFDVRSGSLALARAVPYLTAGVVLAAVDAAGGGGRPAVAIEVAGGRGVFVGPDNGLLAPAVALAGGAERCVTLVRTEHHLEAPGATFPCRDVYAPVVAALCTGVDLADLGDPVDPGDLLPAVLPLPRDDGGMLVGEVMWIDRFGNCQLNIGPEDVAPWGDRARLHLTDGVRNVPIVDGYHRLGVGAPGLVVDATGMLSIAVERSSAARELGLAVGDPVSLGPADGEGPGGAPVTTPVATPVTTPVTLRPSGAAG
jgi:S-adenosylmethionine hydrolase